MADTGIRYLSTCDPNYPITFGFRRRCAWCGRCLRGWQVNMCRGCKSQIPVCRGEAPYPEGFMWKAPLDRWKWPWQ